MLSVSNIRTAVRNGNFNKLSSLEFVPRDNSPDPWMNNGRFGVVFKMQHPRTKKYYALKVIKENNAQKNQRLKEVAQSIENYPSPYWIGYLFYPQELTVNTIAGTEAADVILMEWIEGDTLGDYFKKLCETNNQKALAQLAYRFDTLAFWLLQNPFAHGDLKQDNLLVRPNGNLVLVDYDGIFSPQFEGQYAYEIGTSDYQHPQRDHTHFGSYIDDFSILVISLALYAAARQPQLYTQYCQGDNMLLCSDDFDTQTPSPLITTLRQSLQPAIRQRVALLDYALALTPQSIIALPQCLQNTQNYTLLLEYIQQPLPSFATNAEAQTWYNALSPNLKEAINLNIQLHNAAITTEEIEQLIKCNIPINDIARQLLPPNAPQAPITATNLNNLRYFFNPSDDKLTDITPLSKLTNLQTLYLSVCENLTDISPLSTLTNLQTLDLSVCENLTDISPLSTLNNLQTLNLGWCYSLEDISPLTKLTNLQTLSLNSCKNLTDISPLSTLTNLQTLSLNSCKNLTDISPLSTLTNLQTLDLSWCENLTDISPLSKLTNLQTLDLGDNNLTDISPLSTLTNLQTLDLSVCENLTDISPLSKLTNLQNLNLIWCQYLTNIHPLSKLTNLQTLNLWRCKNLTDISPLSKLNNLQSLDLYYCSNLTDISPLSTLNNLQKLDLRECKNLTDISPLKTLTNLQTLIVGECHYLLPSAIEQLQKQLPSCEITWWA